MNAGVFRRVLIPVEFGPLRGTELAPERSVRVGPDEWIAVSESTTKALEMGARLALGGDVYVIHAIAEFIAHANWMTPSGASELDEGARADAIKVLGEVARQRCCGVTRHLLTEVGRPLEVILGAAAQCGAEAIVLAASARHRVQRAVLGSTVDKVVRRSPCPVMVVPAGAG